MDSISISDALSSFFVNPKLKELKRLREESLLESIENNEFYSETKDSVYSHHPHKTRSHSNSTVKPQKESNVSLKESNVSNKEKELQRESVKEQNVSLKEKESNVSLKEKESNVSLKEKESEFIKKVSIKSPNMSYPKHIQKHVLKSSKIKDYNVCIFNNTKVDY